VIGEPVIGPGSRLFFLCQQYSLVFLLDMSPNMRSVSNNTHAVKIDSAVSALNNTLHSLTQPVSSYSLACTYPGGLQGNLCTCIIHVNVFFSNVVMYNYCNIEPLIYVLLV